MTCCSTSRIVCCLPSTPYRRDVFRRARRPPLAVEPGGDGRDEGDQIGEPVRGVVLGQVHHFDEASLCLQERLQLGKADAREPVPVLHHDAGDMGVFEECQQPWTAVVHPGGDRFDLLDHLIPPCRAVVRQPGGLALQVVLVRGRGDAGVDRHALRARRRLL